MLRSSQGLSAETVDGHRCQIEVVLAKTLNGIMFFYAMKKTAIFFHATSLAPFQFQYWICAPPGPVL